MLAHCYVFFSVFSVQCGADSVTQEAVIMAELVQRTVKANESGSAIGDYCI